MRMNRLHQLRHDERGISTIFVGVGFMAFFAATTLAIDVGMFMTARNQAQNAADAGALAGAVALVYNDFNNRTSTGPAVQNAVAASSANLVMKSGVSVGPSDVTFPVGPTGLSNRVRVFVYRTAARQNPIPTLVGPLFGVNNVDIRAVATAEASPANAVTCVKPFIIPDRWTENQNGPWDPDDTFDRYDNKGNVIPNADVYNGDLNSPNYSGYNATRDKGLELMLRAQNGNKVFPTMYFSWKMPGDDIGADFYRNNISGCNSSLIDITGTAIQEPGAMEGPTIDGIDDLIAKDPNAVWNDGCNCVKNSAFAVSPRIFPIPVYDPDYYQSNKMNGRNADLKVANIIGFFVTYRTGSEIHGRIHPITGQVTSSGPAPQNSFAMAIRLVE
jgi:Flp pilus assembly protein TadG